MRCVFILLAFACSLAVAEPFGLDWAGMNVKYAEDGSVFLDDNSTAGGSYIISEGLKLDFSAPWIVSVEARCEGVRNGRTQMYAQVFDAKGKVIKSHGSNSISGNRGWTKMSIVVPAGEWPEGTASVRVILQPAAGPAEATGKAWFRNFKQGVAEGAMANPAPWKLQWAGSPYEIEEGVMVMEDTSTAGGGYIVSSDISVDVTKAFRVSFEARCENVMIGRSQGYLFVFDDKGNRIGDFGTGSISGTKDWTRLSVEVPANKWPAATHHIKVMMQPAAGPAEATGKAWFRNLTHCALENPLPIEGRECTGEFVFKYGNITLVNKKLNAFPFEHNPKMPRLEIMRKNTAHVSAVQILTDDVLPTQAQVAYWIEGKEEYSELKPMPLVKVPRGYLVDVSQLPLCRKFALAFNANGALTFDDVQVSRMVFPEEDWKANWIWFTADRVEMINVHLRKEFELKAAPVKAMWQCAADDGAEVYFNGQRQFNVDGRFAPPNEDIAKKLHAGKNVITVSVHQARYAAGFLGELDLYFEDGSYQKLLTDKTWKYFPSEKEIRAEAAGAKGVRPPANWHTTEYDSSALKNCVELGVPPLGAWGAVKYRMNAPRLPLILLTPAYPATIQAGRKYEQDVRFHVDTPCKMPTPIRLQLMRGEQTFLEWEVGIAPIGKKEFSFPFTLELSPFIYPGEYKMRMVVSGYQATGTDGKPCDIQTVNVVNTRRAQTPVAKIQRDANGVPTLNIDGKPYTSIFAARGLSGLKQHGAQFAKSGLHLYHVYLIPSWPTPDSATYVGMDAIAENLLQSDPEAKFIVKIELRDGKPSWYLPKYPDEAVVFENGKKANHVSLASWHWKEFVGDYLRGLVKHVEGSPYADHCIGYFACEGEEGQWMHYWGGGDPTAVGTLSDYSPVMLQYFRQWLRREYKTDAALQKAWNDSSVTFDTAQIPTRQERTDGICQFRKLPQNRKAMDFGWALSDVVSEGIVYYAKIIKEASGGKALTGALYGHLMDLGGGFLGEQVGYARQKLPVETPYIDYYLGPISYSHRFRDIGYPGGYDMPSPGSLELHNKIWVNEDDLRTHLNFPAEYAYSVRTPAQTMQQLAREVVKAVCGRAGFYYFPLGDNSLAWFDDPETIDDIRQLTLLGNKTLQGDRRSTSEIAVFFDDDAQCRLRQMGRSQYASINTYAIMQREAIFRIGAPSDEFLQFDICNPNLKPYKLYVFLNPYFLKDDQIAAIQKLAKQKDVRILFCSTPGVAGDNGIDKSVAEKLTGMPFVVEKEARTASFATSKAFGELKAGALFGNKEKQIGVVRPVSGYDEVLATFDGTDVPAVVRKGNIYVSILPDLHVQMLREIAQGVKVYTYSDDNIAVYACAKYLGYHSSKEKRPCVFRAPAGKKMRQIWPFVSNPPAISEYRWNNTEPETRMFEIE